MSVELGGKRDSVDIGKPILTASRWFNFRFFFLAPQSERSEDEEGMEKKIKSRYNTTRLFSTTDRHCPLCYKQLNEYEKQETESCCETHNILNETGTLVCGNCGQVEGYEYLNFYENLHEIKKKSVYHRKCHIENTLPDVCSKNIIDLPPINKQTNIANI